MQSPLAGASIFTQVVKQKKPFLERAEATIAERSGSG
jgi:hypothetical protein